MNGIVEQHTSRLRLLCGAFLLSTLIYGVVVFITPPPETPPLARGDLLMWAVVVLALVNLATLMPVYRAMLAGPRRAYAEGQQVEPLLAAHTTAHVVACARLEVLGVLGLVVFFLTGRGDWFWILNGVAAVGLVLLWPLREKVETLLGATAVAGTVSAG
ncbi:MAG: hypothetical protein V1750_07615 [Acidobacteriota bacterium]